MTVEELRLQSADYAADRVENLVKDSISDPEIVELCKKCAYTGATFFQTYYFGHENELDKPAPKKRGRKPKAVAAE